MIYFNPQTKPAEYRSDFFKVIFEKSEVNGIIVINCYHITLPLKEYLIVQYQYFKFIKLLVDNDKNTIMMIG